MHGIVLSGPMINNNIKIYVPLICKMFTVRTTAEQGVCLLPNRDSHLEAMTKVLTLLSL